MTISVAAERPRIMAALSESPGLGAYELAAALGYGKRESRRVAEIVRRMHSAGIVVAHELAQPRAGQPARIYFVAPEGTPSPRRESPVEAERRRRRDRVNQQRRRARLAGKPAPPEPADRPRVYLPPSPPMWRLPGDPACAGADPGLFFGRDGETPRERARRVAKAQGYCHQCPVRTACLNAARARGERFGVWGGADLEAERKNQPTKATRPGAATPDRA
jgi:WhiB family transcriptional regulator, redox-sensing transcriptional regulator